MSVKRYMISDPSTFAEVTLDVDHDKLTPELAAQINEFFVDADARLAAAEEDVVIAVIKMAAASFIGGVLDPCGFGEVSMQREFDQQEGWPPNGEHGIRLVEFDGRPVVDSVDLELEEIQ